MVFVKDSISAPNNCTKYKVNAADLEERAQQHGGERTFS